MATTCRTSAPVSTAHRAGARCGDVTGRVPRGCFVGRALALALAITASGCGAKTGLEVPDAQIDSGPDAGMPDAQIPCIEIPIDGGLIDLPLVTEVEVGRADVVFAIDTTASMGQEIAAIRSDLRAQIAPAIAASIQDSQIGVTTFADFPEGSCGQESEGDRPFRLVLPVTPDLGRVQTAVDSVVLNNGSDEPESQVEALYQIATGEGIGRYVAPSLGCPMGGFGYPCFRGDAVPVVLLFTDAPFHNGPAGSFPFDDPRACPRIVPTPHTYSEAVSALDASGVRVIGLYSGPPGEEGLAHLQAIARDTDAVDASGAPLVFDIGTRGERLSESVIRAIQTLAEVLEFDTVDTFLLDVDRTDAIDPREFVEAVVPVSASPADGVREIDVDAGLFRGVRTGTALLFQLRVRSGIALPGPGPHRFLLEVVFRGDMRTRIGSMIVEIVIGGECMDDGIVVPIPVPG
jgi:predicted small lipoprotein YifL